MSKGLGKGLDALIPSLHLNEDDKVIEIPLSKLRPNPYQPRKHFDDESINELAASIKEHGVIQPIIVRSVVKGFEIIAGERRFRASQACGMATIPAVVKSFTDQQVMEIALIENVQREDLNAVEIANAYQGLINQFSLTQEELSAKVGKSRSHIANFLRLLQLPEPIKQYVSRGTISMGHARAIAGLKNKKQQVDMAERTIREQWSVRELEDELKRYSGAQEQPEPNTPTGKPKEELQSKRDPFLHQAEDDLTNLFQTTVKIRNKQNKGRIEMLFYSKDDLDRLLSMLNQAK
jgi:ParB family chromosome partitioning protein